jgi:class 3 adenylate cyclase
MPIFGQPQAAPDSSNLRAGLREGIGMGDLPSGTVTFLFTDLEGSTRLWEEDPDAMRVAVARHDVLLEDAISRHAGVVFSRMGDGMAAAFASAPQGIAAAVDAQLALTDESWGAVGPLRARGWSYTLGKARSSLGNTTANR